MEMSLTILSHILIFTVGRLLNNFAIAELSPVTTRGIAFNLMTKIRPSTQKNYNMQKKLCGRSAKKEVDMDQDNG